MSGARTRGTTGSRKPITDEELKRRAEEFARTRAFFEQQDRRKAGIPSGRAMGAQILGDCDETKLAQKKNELVAAAGRNVSPYECLAVDTNLSCPKNRKKALKKLRRLHPDKNKGCTELAGEMMKKYQECCYHQVDEEAGHTFVKWNANDKEWRNPAYPLWYETAEASARRRAEQDAELDAIQAGFSSKRGDFSDSSLERDLDESDVERDLYSRENTMDQDPFFLRKRVDVADLRRQFEEEGYGKYITRAEEEEERKRNAEIERKRKDDMEKKATKIQALQRGRTSRRKNPSAALCRMCEAPGFYDPKCDLCPEGTGKKKEFRRRTSADELNSDFSLPSDIGSSEPESMEKRYPPPAKRGFQPTLTGCESVRIKGKKGSAVRRKSVKACTSKQGCKVGKVTTSKGKKKTRCVTRKKGRKKGKRRMKRICADDSGCPEEKRCGSNNFCVPRLNIREITATPQPEQVNIVQPAGVNVGLGSLEGVCEKNTDCPENQICNVDICVPVEAGMVRPVGEALPRTDPGAILRGQVATVEGKSAEALQRADEARRERILREDGGIAPPRPSNIGAVADARAEEARDPMTDFRLFLVSSNCPKLTDKEIKDLTNLFD